MGEAAGIVQVVYATREDQRIVDVPLAVGLTALQAVERSGFLLEFPEILSTPLVLGVFGERVESGRVLAEGDRVEICRSLQQDPRDMRASLAAHGGVMGRPKDGRAS